jgi:hypothetical protein
MDLDTRHRIGRARPLRRLGKTYDEIQAKTGVQGGRSACGSGTSRDRQPSTRPLADERRLVGWRRCGDGQSS